MTLMFVEIVFVFQFNRFQLSAVSFFFLWILAKSYIQIVVFRRELRIYQVECCCCWWWWRCCGLCWWWQVAVSADDLIRFLCYISVGAFIQDSAIFLPSRNCYIYLLDFPLFSILQILENTGWFSWQFEHLVSLGQSSAM